MPELRSALAAHLKPGRYGADSGEPRLTLSERPLGTLMQLSGWRNSFESAAAPLLQQLGFSGIGDFQHAQVKGDAICYRVSPERVLVRLPSASAWAAVAAKLDPALTPVLDLSHSRSVIRIAGADAADMLARCMPIDFDPANFPADRFVQSGIHSVGVLAHRRAGEPVSTFDVYVPASFAATLWDFLGESAEPFGYRVTGG